MQTYEQYEPDVYCRYPVYVNYGNFTLSCNVLFGFLVPLWPGKEMVFTEMYIVRKRS